MKDKDRLVLADGTQITLELSKGIGELHVNAESRTAAAALWEMFTPGNLKRVLICNAEGTVTGNYEDLVLDHITGTDGSRQVEIIFSLRPKTREELLEERIAELEAARRTHGEAISDLGQAVSDMMEGGGK